MADVSFYTDRELVHERFNWRSYDHMVSAVRELQSRGYVVDRDGVMMSEENMLGQVGLRQYREARGDSLHCPMP